MIHKRILSGLVIAVSLISLLASSLPPEQKPDLPSPPNGRWLRDSLFIDETEIANIHWMEFMHFSEDSGQYYYEALLPDTLSMAREVLPLYDAHIRQYLTYPGFRFFPVVGVSYEQVLEYCKWRSLVVTKTTNEKLKDDKKWKDYYVEYTFRLPTKEEWETAARGKVTDNPYGFTRAKRELPDKKNMKAFLSKLDTGLSLKQFENYIRNYYNQHPLYGRGNYRVKTPPFYENFRHKDTTKVSIKITEWINAYQPNSHGLYNMIGNVAEMVQEKGIAKGGSWVDLLEDCVIDKDKTYKRSEAWLGFRCVCEVRVRRK